MEILLTKLLICLIAISGFFPKVPVQDQYTIVNSDSIKLNGIRLEDSENIKSRLFSKKVRKKIYTPPSGDSDEYDKIHYWEDDNLKIDFYEKNSYIRVSSIIIKTDKIAIIIGKNKFQVGQKQTVLARFENSYVSLCKQQQKNQPSADSGFYLNIVRKNSKEQGLMTCFIKQNTIAEVAISFDPA